MDDSEKSKTYIVLWTLSNTSTLVRDVERLLNDAGICAKPFELAQEKEVWVSVPLEMARHVESIVRRAKNVVTIIIKTEYY